MAIGVVIALAAFTAVGGVLIGLQLSDGDDETAAPPATSTTTSTTAPPAATYTTEEIASRFGSSVWRVEADGCGEIWTGSAFAIDPHHLVTNHHVVAIDPTPTLVSRDGERMEGRVVGWSERPDLAVIEADGLLNRWLEWSPTEEVVEGESLVVLGYPVPETDFTVTPGSVLSFQLRSEVREAIRSDAAIDRGNSGGPALDTSGRVMGVVTEMAANEGGFQLVPLIFTHDALADTIEQILASPQTPDADCSFAEWGGGTIPEGFDEHPDTWDSGAESYGDHPELDRLWDACDDGDMGACDELWWLSPAGSEYESFADTCGNRSKGGYWCDEETAG